VNPPITVIFLVPLAMAGLALMNTGLGRTRSAAHSMLTALATMALAACVYCLLGFCWEGFAGQAGHSIFLGGKPWNWIASDPSLLRGPAFGGSAEATSAFLQVFTVGMAALIPLASGADRWRLNASLISTALLAGWTYPLFAHWVWGGGWLSQLGINYGLGEGFLDAGGASTIHVVGGLSALAVAWILGPRLGKVSPEGHSTPIPGYNIVFVLFGCLLMLPGWIAINVAGSYLFAGIPPAQTALVAVNTLLSASASCLAALATTGVRFSKPDASLCASGWTAGLVTSSALCAFVTPEVAIFTGLVAGVLVTLTVEFLEVHLLVDDPGGAIPAHALAGIWGLLAVGLFVHIPKLAGEGIHPRGQFLAQLVGVATLIGFVLPMTYALNWIVNRFYPQRVDSYGERMGMDFRELGGGAYPEFVVRSDEFTQR
jgi:ammonium transporter, Amt family